MCGKRKLPKIKNKSIRVCKHGTIWDPGASNKTLQYKIMHVIILLYMRS